MQGFVRIHCNWFSCVSINLQPVISSSRWIFAYIRQRKRLFWQSMQAHCHIIGPVIVIRKRGSVERGLWTQRILRYVETRLSKIITTGMTWCSPVCQRGDWMFNKKRSFPGRLIFEDSLYQLHILLLKIDIVWLFRIVLNGAWFIFSDNFLFIWAE